MNKLNFDTMQNITLSLDENSSLDISPVKAYSWAKALVAQELLKQTIEYIKKWYWSKKDLENVLNGIGSLWETLKDTIAEAHLQDFINQGMLSANKDILKDTYNSLQQPFEDGLQHLTDFYFELTLDEAGKKAYREYRKENRGRFAGYGYGLTGSITAAAGAGLGNLASGLAHGAFNAVANGIGSITKSYKLTQFYKEESTLNALINGWIETYWHIYEEHILLVNNNLIEKDTTKLIGYKTLMENKRMAENKFKNLQRAKMSDPRLYIGAIIECIDEFPFEKQYWKIFFTIFIVTGIIDADLYDRFIVFFSKVGPIIPDFTFATELVESLVSFYIEKDSDDSSKAIVSLLQEKLKTDKAFQETFGIIIKNQFKQNDLEMPVIRRLFILIGSVHYDVKQLTQDTEFVDGFNGKMRRRAYDTINQNSGALISAIKESNTAAIAKILDSENSEYAFLGIMKLISISNIAITGDILTFCENLKTAFNISQDINSFEMFRDIKNRLIEQNRIAERKNIPLEIKIQEFQQYMQALVNDHGIDILGKNVYWENIPSKITANVKKHFEFSNSNEQIFIVFDDTIFHSVKHGLAITSLGIRFRDDSYCWKITWEELAEQCNIELEYVFKLTFKSNEKSPVEFKRGIMFSDKELIDIDFEVLSSIIKEACLIFTGAEITIEKLKNTLKVNFNRG